jgi:hypothetical protein
MQRFVRESMYPEANQKAFGSQLSTHIFSNPAELNAYGDTRGAFSTRPPARVPNISRGRIRTEQSWEDEQRQQNA